LGAPGPGKTTTTTAFWVPHGLALHSFPLAP
jgi:hypothetical protein